MMSRISATVVFVVIAAFALAGCAGPHRTPPAALSTTTQAVRPLACPAPSTEPTGPASVLVPPAPDRGMVCRYGGMNEPDVHQLVRSATLTGAPLSTLVAALNSERIWPADLRIPCPADFDHTDLLLFGYPDGHQQAVHASLSGCASATNGGRTVFLSDGVRQRLTALVGTWPVP
jgi:hypothetical protein